MYLNNFLRETLQETNSPITQQKLKTIKIRKNTMIKVKNFMLKNILKINKFLKDLKSMKNHYIKFKEFFLKIKRLLKIM
jgi:hypothetical protein